MSKKIRPLGDILLDIEPLLNEMYDTHKLEAGDLHGLLHQYNLTHRPDVIEVYLDGTTPVYWVAPELIE